MTKRNRVVLTLVILLPAVTVTSGLGFWLGRNTVNDAASAPLASSTPAGVALSATPTAVAPTATETTIPTATRDPRVREYRKLASVRAGMYIGRFEDTFGTPLLIRKSSDGSRIEKTFAGPNYFVQAIQDIDGTVRLMAVTSCDEEFQPTFVVPDGSITLSKTLMKDFPRATDHLYFVGGTSNTYLYDQSYTGNSGGYRMYLAGVDDACNYHVNFDIVRKYVGGQNITGSFNDPDIVALRGFTTITTYAETSPLDFILSSALGADPTFQVGVDRIRVRGLGSALDATFSLSPRGSVP